MAEKLVDHYKILEVEKTATIKEIKKAYKRLALKWHPDKNPDDKENATAKFSKINNAYEILSDETRRREYDWEVKDAERGRTSKKRFEREPEPSPPPFNNRRSPPPFNNRRREPRRRPDLDDEYEEDKNNFFSSFRPRPPRNGFVFDNMGFRDFFTFDPFDDIFVGSFVGGFGGLHGGGLHDILGDVFGDPFDIFVGGPPRRHAVGDYGRRSGVDYLYDHPPGNRGRNLENGYRVPQPTRRNYMEENERSGRNLTGNGRYGNPYHSENGYTNGPSSYKPYTEYESPYKPRSEIRRPSKPENDDGPSNSRNGYKSTYKPSSEQERDYKPRSAEYRSAYRQNENFESAYKPKSEYKSAYRPNSEKEGDHKPKSEYKSAYRPSTETDFESSYKPRTEYKSSYNPSGEKDEGAYKPRTEYKSSYKPSSEKDEDTYKPRSEQNGDSKPRSEYKNSYKPSGEKDEDAFKPRSEYKSAYRPSNEKDGPSKTNGEYESTYKPRKEYESAYSKPNSEKDATTKPRSENSTTSDAYKPRTETESTYKPRDVDLSDAYTKAYNDRKRERELKSRKGDIGSSSKLYDGIRSPYSPGLDGLNTGNKPRPESNGTHVPTSGSDSTYKSPPPKDSGDSSSNTWSCPKCTLINENWRSICNACHYHSEAGSSYTPRSNLRATDYGTSGYRSKYA